MDDDATGNKIDPVAEVIGKLLSKEASRGEALDAPLIGEIEGFLDDGPLGGLCACPVCGAEMMAEQDPDHLLSFPMVWLFTCVCGHNERRTE